MTAQLEDHVRGAIAQDSRDADVPAERIGVKVSAGWVTLTGTVDYEFQSDAAFDDVAMIKGIGGITNKIRVVTSRPRADARGLNVIHPRRGQRRA